MTMPSPKPSTVFTRPSLSTGADHGGTSRPSSSPPSNGSTGSTTEGSWSPSATYRQPKPSNATTPCWNNRPWRHNLNQTASGNPGSVHPQFRRTNTPQPTRPLQTASLATFRGDALTDLLAGLAANSIGSFVKGFTPLRASVAGLFTTDILTKPGMTNSPDSLSSL